MNNEELSKIISDVTSKYNIEGSGSFIDTADFKLRWKRSDTWIIFAVSDYLDEAPEEAIRDAIDQTMKRILYNDVAYPESLKEYITSKEFRKKNIKTFWERKQTTDVSESENVNFEEIVNNLIEQGLIKKTDKLSLRLSLNDSKPNYSTSVLMRTIIISKKMDTDKIPEFVHEYLLYREICHIKIGLDVTGEIHSKKYDKLIKKYKKYKEAEEWLNQ